MMKNPSHGILHLGLLVLALTAAPAALAKDKEQLPHLRIPPAENVYHTQDVQLELSSNGDMLCVLASDRIQCARYRENTKEIDLNQRGRGLKLGEDDSGCYLEGEELKCFGLENPAKGKKVSDFLIRKNYVCALTDGKILCNNQRDDRDHYSIANSSFLGVPDMLVEELRHVEYLFSPGGNLFCAQTGLDAYCWSATTYWRKKQSATHAFNLARLIRIPENRDPREIRFLDLELTRWDPPNRPPSQDGVLLEYSYVSGNRLFQTALVLTYKDRSFFGKEWQSRKWKILGQRETELPGIPTAHLPGTPCYVFNAKVQCLKLMTLQGMEYEKAHQWIESSFHREYEGLIKWMERLEGISQITSQYLRTESREVCALHAGGLSCARRSKYEWDYQERRLPPEIIQHAGNSNRISLHSLSSTLQRLGSLLYIERAQVLEKQVEAFEGERKRAAPFGVHDLFFAALVRPFLGNIDSALLNIDIFPHFRSQLDQSMNQAGVAVLADFGFDPTLIRTALRTLALDLQILKQHATSLEDRSIIEQAIGGAGDALASRKFRSGISYRQIVPLLETLSTSSRTRCYALQALTALEYLDKGGLLLP